MDDRERACVESMMIGVERKMTDEAFEQELERVSDRNSAGRLGMLIRERKLYGQAIVFALHSDPRLAWKSSRALEYALAAGGNGFDPYIADFLDAYCRISSPGAWRHSTKILVRLLESGRAVMDAGRREAVSAALFDLLIASGVKPGVKVWAMEALFLLSDGSGWMERELYGTIRKLMSEGSPALEAGGRRVCRKIRARCGAEGRMWRE